MNFIEIMQTTFEPTLLKLLISVILTFGFLFGELHTQGIIAVLMLVSFDTILGVMASWQEGQAITSRRFGRVVQKLCVYMIAISAGFFTDSTIGWHMVQSTMIAFIAVTEFLSVMENMGRLGYETPKKLLNQLEGFRSQK
jgi:phage-related holin